MAKEYLLVDGYNIIHAWPELKGLADENLEDARNKLLDILSNYQGYKKNEIIVVFDAHQVKGNRNVVQYNNIDVVYTKEAETADHFIERVAHQLAKQYLIKVATSDALEQMIILARGATRISARELRIEIMEMNRKMDEEFIKKPIDNRNRFEHYLSPEVVAWMEKLRRK